mmetsp:Transcript_43729/g.135044  ORF Transcript_43729/g.135044 Transcript_43729/m.135044 type:complete len:404 (+) Transcript_43729:458-1669(+)
MAAATGSRSAAAVPVTLACDTTPLSVRTSSGGTPFGSCALNAAISLARKRLSTLASVSDGARPRSRHSLMLATSDRGSVTPCASLPWLAQKVCTSRPSSDSFWLNMLTRALYRSVAARCVCVPRVSKWASLAPGAMPWGPSSKPLLQSRTTSSYRSQMPIVLFAAARWPPKGAVSPRRRRMAGLRCASSSCVCARPWASGFHHSSVSSSDACSCGVLRKLPGRRPEMSRIACSTAAASCSGTSSASPHPSSSSRRSTVGTPCVTVTSFLPPKRTVASVLSGKCLKRSASVKTCFDVRRSLYSRVTKSSCVVCCVYPKRFTLGVMRFGVSGAYSSRDHGALFRSSRRSSLRSLRKGQFHEKGSTSFAATPGARDVSKRHRARSPSPKTAGRPIGVATVVASNWA